MSDFTTPSGIRVSKPAEHPHVWVVTIDRPPVNPLNNAATVELGQVFDGLPTDGSVRCVVLTGAGEKAFCAGADVREFGALNPISSLRRSRQVRSAFDAVREAPVPVIAAVNGAALGTGVGLAGACDVVVAADSAVFGLPEINVGRLGGASHLLRLVPAKKMRWMALTGQRLTARELAQYGNVEKVVPLNELMPLALSMADEVAGKAPSVVRTQKEMLNLAEEMDLLNGYHVETLGSAIISGNAEAVEASKAMLEKRKPRFE
jgi:enoyl-CoA hydratase